ncbi:hypothetical protein [Arsukibacterium sp.]|uniref:hypothetical protein n=1 Tax=Arsukibacterium sp. TaxID=1977258 RepID=UPI002FD97631
MKWLSLLLLVMLILHPLSAQANSLEHALTACRAEQNALKRLVCYDDIHLTNKAELPAAVSGTTSDPRANAADVKGASTAQPDAAAAKAKDSASERFGLEHQRQPEQASELSFIVSKISYNNRKELVVEFDNGQVWRQQGSGHYPIAVGEQHQIKRGMLGGFNLSNARNNRTIRVQRER